ncbi:hypothetical protein [Lysobacter sp. HA35]
MLRELHQLLDELHDGLTAIEVKGGVRLSNVDMTLPLELRPIFRDGGCVLLADVPRQRALDGWLPTASRLVIGWSAEGAAETHRANEQHGGSAS